MLCSNSFAAATSRFRWWPLQSGSHWNSAATGSACLMEYFGVLSPMRTGVVSAIC